MKYEAINAFGLTDRQVDLLAGTLNGSTFDELVPPTTAFLVRAMLDAIESSHFEIAKFGQDLATMEKGNPEIPHEYQDLYELILKLPDWKSTAICYYILGCFVGQEIVHDALSKSR